MIPRLLEIVQARVARPPDLSVLRERFPRGVDLQTPAQSLRFAIEYCRLSQPFLAAPLTVAEQGANLLVEFLAALPQPLHAAIEAVAVFADPAPRAWDEPLMDPFVGMSCTVEDVWAHLLGPEAAVDGQVVAQLLAHDARFALDFGAGAGHFAHELALRGICVDAIEIDAVKRTFFEFRAARSGLGERMRVEMLRDTYDLVFAIDVLDHVHEPAAAVGELVRRTHPGSMLCTLAAFPLDGWHQADEHAVDACAEAIWRHFVPVPSAGTVAHLECFRRRESDESACTYPVLHPCACVRRLDDSQNHAIVVDSRFCLPMLASEDAIGVCAWLDGRRSTAEIARLAGVEHDELVTFLAGLRDSRLLSWDANTVNAQEAGVRGFGTVA